MDYSCSCLCVSMRGPKKEVEINTHDMQEIGQEKKNHLLLQIVSGAQSMPEGEAILHFILQ